MPYGWKACPRCGTECRDNEEYCDECG